MYRFGEFALDVRTRRLLHGAQELHLSPKAFDLLALLIAHRAEAVSKEELHRQLWPSTYVLETNLAGLVKEIRGALADPALQPRFIRTVHRFGYWFVGEVAEETGAASRTSGRVRYWLMWESRQVPLESGDNVLGRAQDAGVWIDAPGVSRRHACIRLNGTTATIEDLGSKNGTYLHGQRLDAPVPLTDGDQIRVGSVVITFRIPPPAAMTETEGS